MKIETLFGLAAGFAAIALALTTFRQAKAQTMTSQAATAERTFNNANGPYRTVQTQEQIDYARSVPWNL